MSSYSRKDNPIVGHLNRNRKPKTGEEFIPGDQRTVGLSTLVILHGEDYTPKHFEHLKRREIFCPVERDWGCMKAPLDV